MRGDERARYSQIYSLLAGLHPLLNEEFTSVTELSSAAVLSARRQKIVFAPMLRAFEGIMR